MQFCGHPGGLAAVVRGGVPSTVQHYSSRVQRDAAEAVERGGKVTRAPGTAQQENLAGERCESLQRSGRAVDRPGVVQDGGDELTGGHHADPPRPRLSGT